jgi:hypothetical protein
VGKLAEVKAEEKKMKMTARKEKAQESSIA